MLLHAGCCVTVAGGGGGVPRPGWLCRQIVGQTRKLLLNAVFSCPSAHLRAAHLLWVLGQQVQRPRQRAAGRLVPRHQHRQQVVPKLRGLHLLARCDEEAQHAGVACGAGRGGCMRSGRVQRLQQQRCELAAKNRKSSGRCCVKAWRQHAFASRFSACCVKGASQLQKPSNPLTLVENKKTSALVALFAALPQAFQSFQTWAQALQKLKTRAKAQITAPAAHPR